MARRQRWISTARRPTGADVDQQRSFPRSGHGAAAVRGNYAGSYTEMDSVAHRSGFVSILGRPNAGKSTLLNRLVGEKVAIVSRKPQTTRTSIQGVLTTPEAQVVFVDTPGIHKSTSLINKRMMDVVRGALEDRDVLLYLDDSTRPLTEEDEHAVSVLNGITTPAFL